MSEGPRGGREIGCRCIGTRHPELEARLRTLLDSRRADRPLLVAEHPLRIDPEAERWDRADRGDHSE